MGKGSISLKGRRQGPWLEICRPETERSYLLHQVKQLRQCHDGPLEVVHDRLPGTGFYDDERVRIRSEALRRAYELLYPRDERFLSERVLSIVGQQGLAALWSDQAELNGNFVVFKMRRSAEEVELLRSWLQGMGRVSEPWPSKGKIQGFKVRLITGRKIYRSLMPLLHGDVRKNWRSLC
jgi:hypothetical protein